MFRQLFVLSSLLVCSACGPVTITSDAGADGGGSGGGDGGGTAGGGGGSGSGGGSGGGGGSSRIRRITSISVTPTMLSLKVGGVSGPTARAIFDDGTNADVSGSVQWVSAPSGIVEVMVTSAADNLVSLTALATGSTSVTAKTGTFTSNALTVTVSGATSNDAGVLTPAFEVRAVWVTRFAWNTATEVKAIIDRAAAAGFNVVYFQIRGNGDAYYKSTLVPWAKKLSGVLGKDPGWDPLQTAIDEAHLKGIQLHAYWNVHAAWPVPVGCSTSGGCTCQPTQGLTDSCVLPEASFAGAPDHFLRQHPEAMAVNAAGKSIDSEYYWFSAGDPQVRSHVLAVATELLQKYDVDGLHLDRVRYPGQTYSFDPASNAAYAGLATPKATREDWQRSNVSLTVGDIYAAMKLLRPKAVLSASVWGIYKPLPGCNTSQGYGNYFQDSIGWLKDGKIDALTPMIYWDIGSGCTDWAKLLDGFMAGSNGRHIVAGMHALDSSFVKPDRIKARIAYARQVGAAGTSVFASTYLEQNTASGTPAWNSFKADGGVYEQDAGWPAMSWR